jgi:hypothetical protein
MTIPTTPKIFFLVVLNAVTSFTTTAFVGVPKSYPSIMDRTSLTTRLHSSMFSSNTRTATNQNYDMLRQPGVATTGSGLARAGIAQTGGAIQQQQQQQYGNIDPNNTVQRRLKPIQIQGGSLKTWTFPSSRVESVQVFLKTEGRPLNANVEVWQGPGT